MQLFVIAAILLPAYAVPIIFKDCSGSGLDLNVDVTPCTTQPCSFSHNITGVVTVNFTAPKDSDSLTSHIYGYIEGIRIEWPMPNPDGCKNSGITCPVKAGSYYTYINTLAVPPQAPQIKLVVEWDLIGSNNEKQFCFDFPVQIV